MDHHHLILRFILLSLTFSQFSCSSSSNDRQSLLAFVAAVRDGRSNLNWLPNTSFCTWHGVTCGGSRVVALRLPGAGLAGVIPTGSLGKLDSLQMLSLRSNDLAGSLPSDVVSLPSLRSLHIQHNRFSGNIPTSFSGRLAVLDLSYNSFSGEIPANMVNLSRLSVLKLDHNLLTGLIPDFAASLKQLNLSDNNLSGMIPPSLWDLPSSSFSNNLLLCGAPLSRPCSPAVTPLALLPENHQKGLSIGLVITVVAASVAMALLMVLMLVMRCGWRRWDKKGGGGDRVPIKARDIIDGKPKEATELSSGAQMGEQYRLVFVEGCNPGFDLEQLLRASAEILGRGSGGTTYKAVLEDGTAVVVKRMKEVAAGRNEFEQQMDAIARVSLGSKNVMAPCGYHYSKEEKLLIYDYLPAGSFHALLHGTKGGSAKKPLEWSSRVKIVLGAAYGIAHIHIDGGNHKLIHGNIKSTNILLNHDLDAVVTDYGFAPLLPPSAVPSTSSSRAIVGYRAPEAVQTGKATHKSDVYSFGVLLMEMLTGKAPLVTHSQRRGDHVTDLARWVGSVIREEWTAEVFDSELLKTNRSIEDQMVQMLRIALDCTEIAPELRPDMAAVIRMVEDIQ